MIRISAGFYKSIAISAFKRVKNKVGPVADVVRHPKASVTTIVFIVIRILTNSATSSFNFDEAVTDDTSGVCRFFSNSATKLLESQ